LSSSNGTAGTSIGITFAGLTSLLGAFGPLEC
jgi:hypothetical protein